MDTDKVYIIQEVHGKGLGLVSTIKIPKGTRILSERPLLRVPRSTNSKELLGVYLSKEILALSDDQRQAFFALYNTFEDETSQELGIVRTNALPLGSNASMGGIFLDASRINHSCIQNAQNTWNEDLQRLTIHAIRDINKGEEITIMYLQDRADRCTRQLALQKNFRFTCSCPLCSLSGPQLHLSDARLNEILRLDKSIGDSIQIVASPLQALHDVRKLLRLCEEEGIDDATVPRAYYDAFQIAIFHGDMARATVFAKRAATARGVMEGDDSPTVHRHRELARDPSRHASYGYGSQWATSINDVPSGISAEAFAAWLWREENKTDSARTQNPRQEAGEYADLRNDAMFPCFSALPGENELHLAFFESSDGFSYHLRKHWCFLAEIVDIEQFMRLRLLAKDKTGLEVPVSFYTPGRGNELDPLCVLKGYTLAVLYAEQHGFLDMTVGIRHEDPASLKIFPVALDELLSLSDRVQQCATQANGVRTCQGCGRKADTLKKCARCNWFWYCDKACQTVAWNEKGHKGDCKLLKDPELRGLFLLPQGRFVQPHRFSVS
ncbi:hypothetical protein C7999DRAFT_32301 [Corynascus novoguineensis]|uniref:Suppressor of anucleate metulae protein B n=1 Tax=Corynascus novoguineensis TaxID=1126955 RepID=A0AAN7HNQ9_9PEZI|nr:hypothetical protein C7999DRAFT_32301 [Corynascus novoguineensis]